MNILQSIRTVLGARRLITSIEAERIIRMIAPAEPRAQEIATALAARPDSIWLWSPVPQAGVMRYDQPGTLSHTPEILIVAQKRRVPRWAPHWHRALVLRVEASQ